MESLFGRQFESVDEAKATIDVITLPLGFSIVKQRVRPNSIEFRCSKGRKYSSEANLMIPAERRRQTSSQRTNCPYRLVVGRHNALSPWIIRRSRNDSANEHNHEFLPPGAHSVYRNKAVLKRKDDIIRLYNAGIRPTQILAKIQLEDAEDVKGLTRYDIYNTIRRHRQQELAGRTEMEWLYNQLQNQDAYYYQDLRDQENRLTALFIAPRSGIELFSRFPMVLFMDCTYKTNKFNMPLFNITGITSFKKSFQVAAVFLTGETQGHYAWALGVFYDLLQQHTIPHPQVIVTDRELALMRALDQSFVEAVHLLCRWHVNMNVLAKTKEFFPKATWDKENNCAQRAPQFQAFLKDWNNLIAAPTEEEYNKRLQAMMTPQLGQKAYPAGALRYIITTWLWPWKQKIVRCFVDQQQHFGHTTTSVAESMHSSLKKFLQSSAGDLTTVFSQLTGFWRHQELDIQNHQALRMNKIINSTRQLLYLLIRERVTSTALLLLLQEHKATSYPEQLQKEVCKPCTFRIIYGLPCKHIILKKIARNEPIQIFEIHPFWHWFSGQNEIVTTDVPFSPLIVKGKGRPKGSLSREKTSHIKVTDTIRHPSHFECVLSLEEAEALKDDRLQRPPSSAPARITSRSSILPIRGVVTRSTTAAGLQVVELCDTYVPGTEMQRSYQRTRQRLEDFEDDWDDGINADFEDQMDQALEEAEKSAQADQEELKNTQDCIIVADF